MSVEKWENILASDISKKFHINKNKIRLYTVKHFDILPDKKGSDEVTFEAWLNGKQILKGIASYKSGKLLKILNKSKEIK